MTWFKADEYYIHECGLWRSSWCSCWEGSKVIIDPCGGNTAAQHGQVLEICAPVEVCNVCYLCCWVLVFIVCMSGLLLCCVGSWSIMGRNQRVQLDVVVGWRILPVGSVEILQAEQMFLQSSLLVLLAAHLDVLPAPWIPAGLYGVLPPDVGPVFGPSRWLFLDSLVALGPGAQSSGDMSSNRSTHTVSIIHFLLSCDSRL